MSDPVSASLPACGGVTSFYLSHSCRCIMMSHCGLKAFLLANDAGHLFMYLFAICISFSLTCLFMSLPTFQIGFFFFKLLSFDSSLYVLEISPLAEMRLVNVFFWTVSCFFTSITWSFAEQKF